MKHVIAVSAVLAFLTSACGSSISSGVDAGIPNIADPQLRAPGATPAPAGPSVESISPSSGSSKTRWTLHGTGLSAVAGVWFGNSLATIESVSETEIVVTNAFGTRTAMGILPVTFEAAGERFDGPSVFGYPDGTVRESGNESRTWFRTTSMAANASTIFVADSTRGIYSLDRTTDVVGVIAKNGTNGIQVATAVFVSPSGDVFATDETSEGNRRLLRKNGDTFAPFAVLAEPALDLAFAPNGMMFVVGASSVRKLLDDGTEVLSFQPVIADEIGGGFVQGGTLYVTQRWTATILAIETTWGAVTDLAIGGLSTPGAIAGDGSLLYVADDAGIRSVDAEGQVTTAVDVYAPFSAYSSIDSLVIVGSSVLASEASGTSVIDLGGSSVRIAAAGIGSAYATAHAGGALVVSSFDSCFDAEGSGSRLPMGVVYALTAGSARIVSRDVCPVYGLSGSGDGAVLYTNVSADGTRGEVGRLELASGEREILATEADGLVYPMTAVEDAAGNVYVSEAVFSYPATGFVSKIGVDGSVQSAWAQSPNENGWSWALALSGDSLYVTDVSSLGLWKVSLAEGGVTSIVAGTEAIVPAVDGITADGAGGVLVSDAMSGRVQSIDAAGSISAAQTLETAGAIEVDARTGDVQVVDMSGTGARLFAIMP